MKVEGERREVKGERLEVKGERLEVKGTEYAATPLCTAFTLYTLHSTQKQNIKH